MYSSVSDFLAQYNHEAPSTAKLIAAITDGNFNAEPNSKVRSAGRLAWHIARSIGGIGSGIGLEMTQFSDEQKPNNAAEAVALYKIASAELTEKIKATITDDMLGNEVSMYGMKWTVASVLYMILSHEIHHRGELLIVMRWVGDTPVGVVGPTDEEMQVMMAAHAN